jgi:cyclic beta-1,2-glucan synthetase
VESLDSEPTRDDQELDWIVSLGREHNTIVQQVGHRAPVLPLNATGRSLEQVYACIAKNTEAGKPGTRAEEWLLDNRYILEEASQLVLKSLPPHYVHQLPLISGSRYSMPVVRVRELARCLIQHSAKPLDIDWLEDAVHKYQSIAVLTIGELWALPAFLRLSILDSVVESAKTYQAGPRNSDKDGLFAREFRADEIAGDIVSLRSLNTHDWRQSFERLSFVDRTLLGDAANAYVQLDFESRDRYRDSIEELARATGRSEIIVAKHALELCHRTGNADHRTRHVGYYLVSDGRAELEQVLGYHPKFGRRIRRWVFGRPVLVYFGLLSVFGLSPLLLVSSYLSWAGMNLAAAAATTLIAAIPVTGLAVAMLNGLLTWLVVPRRMFRLDLEKGIPAEHRAAVVMPVLLASPEDVESALEHIEINYLNNTDEQLVFAVLSDWADAPQLTMPGDDVLLGLATKGLRRLNQQYGSNEEHGPFLLLHRSRLWNEAEHCWMGWERKRGKLAEFNRLLAGDSTTSYSTWIGHRDALNGVRYVITLDADTFLPPGTARRLVGTIAHPLNQAVFDRRTGKLESGYTILQPRLEIDPDSTLMTRFTEIFAGDTTLDLYSHATSDVYHDLFARGIFAGKGLYDWRAFERSLRYRVPENTVLSHDLLEGVHGRVALVSDIVLLEQYPSNALAYMRRLHRWIRGDWQLFPWLVRWVPSTKGAQFRNPLALVDQWQIVDNLRRSLLAPSVLALLVLAWLEVFPGPVWLWTVLFSILLAAPLIAEVFNIAGRGMSQPTTLPERLRDAPTVMLDKVEHWLLSIVLLPYESYVVLDAVGRTLYRLFITKRKLLEWTSAAHAQRQIGKDNRAIDIWREMWVSPAIAVVLCVALYDMAPASLVAAAPLLIAWLFAPRIIWWLSRPLHAPPPPVASVDRFHLRRIARRTWLFFEQFVGPANHWLPPDNFQEEPKVALARRTSPTNMGMSLTAALAAYDLGYVDSMTLVARLRNSYEGMMALERHRGHWLNWYGTRELRPLQPHYVSTVDSGNLAVCLVALARGLEHIVSHPPSRSVSMQGIADTVSVLSETLLGAAPLSGTILSELAGRLHAMRRRLITANTLRARWRCIKRLRERDLVEFNARLLETIEDKQLELGRDELSQVRVWIDELRKELRQAHRTFEMLTPWILAFEIVPSVYLEAAEDSVVANHYRGVRTTLDSEICLESLPERCRIAAIHLARLADCTAEIDAPADRQVQAKAWIEDLSRDLGTAVVNAENVMHELRDLAQTADRWVEEMDFRFLYDETRHLFRIGYSITTGTLDPNHYNLLASEARLAGFIAIAKGDVPARHWLYLERPYRRAGRHTVLMSWSATLFEYLMPTLFLRTPQDTLISRACRTAVAMHRDFAERFQLPWGISESSYYQLDDSQTYQYRAFGVPGLGFRRDLGERLVVSPYSSIMALPFDPHGVMSNLHALESSHALGHYGMYEAVDFGRTGKTDPRRARVVRSYMSHHQGMLLLAVDNFLNRDAMVRRFHHDRRVARISMLLHERLPRIVPYLETPVLPPATLSFATRPAVAVYPFSTDRHPPGTFNVLSNGHYTLVLNASGGGAAHWDGIALTPWRFDATRNENGMWVYVKDLERGTLFSITRDPVGADVGQCSVDAGPHVVRYQRHGQDLFCQMDIALSSQHDVEVRKIMIRNESPIPRRILVATYAELALAPSAEYERHPAFARLFVENECLENEHTLVYRRRPREVAEKPLHLAHSLVMAPGLQYRFGWETDRGAFLGRYGHAARPRALEAGIESFTGSSGQVLDAAIGCGVEFTLAPNAMVEMAFLTAVGRSRPELLSVVQSYRSMPRVDWIFQQARMQSEQELHDLQIDPGEFPVVSDVLSAVLAPRAELRRVGEFSSDAQALQSILWPRGISGDNPIILQRVRAGSNMSMIDRILKIHTYICARQIAVDLVLLDEESFGYARPMRDRLDQAVSAIRSLTHRRLRGLVFVIPAQELAPTTQNGLMAAAHLVLDSAEGDIATQLAKVSNAPVLLPPFVPVRSPEWRPLETRQLDRPNNLLNDNGLGGFSPDGTEYVIHLEPGRHTPAPWANVIANPIFGCLVTEAGTSCTWRDNSSEQRLTPWPNDPVTDRSGEVVYLRDEETGQVWTPTPQPLPDGHPHQVRHGAGYSIYRHNSPGLSETCQVYVDRDAPVKICRITLCNEGSWTRRITVTYFVEWVLGTTRAGAATHIRCAFDPDVNALLAHNAFSGRAGPSVAFLTSSLPPHGLTTDRAEFLGRSSDTRAPAALYRIGLSGELRGGDDPCGAYQVHVDIEPGATQDVYFVLGQGADRDEAVAMARRFQDPKAAAVSLEQNNEMWEDLLGAVQVQTPEPEMDLLLNRWLLYQVLAARLWGRTGYYQSSGAYGFRDQLQDVLSLTWTAPRQAREHIVRAAGRQFRSGDVLHWWHEAPLRGVRTRCSDDMLWLPFAVAHYVSTTGDDSILLEQIEYLHGPELRKMETEYYSEFTSTSEQGSLYEHCCHAIDRAAVLGPHGLPIIGSGDWNDGFNRVGTLGQGESVWLAWFLMRVCEDFAPICDERGEPALAHRFRLFAKDLRRRVDEHAWDGEWYRRAYYDDGTPIGSAKSEECRIDLIAQTWSVLSGGASNARARRAMQSVWDRLVREEDRLILLLEPPFDSGNKDPGYIKAYPQGVRENGGQYTHAATWAVWAAAESGDAEGAFTFFRLLNPVIRSTQAAGMEHYRVEPYVLAGDIYGIPPHTGRGGWSWYSGAAAWLYRAGIEALLGLKQRDDQVELRPCLPGDWSGYRAQLRCGRSSYRLEVKKRGGAGPGDLSITLDGRRLKGDCFPFIDDGLDHVVTATLIPVVDRDSGALDV